MSEKLFDLLRQKEDYERLMDYVKKTTLEIPIANVLKKIYKRIKKELKKII